MGLGGLGLYHGVFANLYLRWAKANIERVSGGMGASQEPVARENYEEDEAPF